MGSVIIEGGTHTVPVKREWGLVGGGGGQAAPCSRTGGGRGGGGETHVVPVERAGGGGGYETHSTSGTEGCLLYKRVLYAYK